MRLAQGESNIASPLLDRVNRLAALKYSVDMVPDSQCISLLVNHEVNQQLIRFNLLMSTYQHKHQFTANGQVFLPLYISLFVYFCSLLGAPPFGFNTFIPTCIANKSDTGNQSVQNRIRRNGVRCLI